MNNVCITGSGIYLPPKNVSNYELFKKIKGFNVAKARQSLSSRNQNVNKLDDRTIFDLWVQQVSGIKQRTYLQKDSFPDQSLFTEYMAKEACLNAVKDAGLSINDIDHIVLSSYTGETLIPSPVCGLIGLLNASNLSGITVNGACSGFLDGMIDATAKIRSGLFKNILVVASEYITNKLDYSDVTTSILFSDGAGAFVLSKGENKIFGSSSKINYSDEHIKMLRSSVIKMGGGPLVQRKAVNAMAEVGLDALQKSNLSIDDIKYIVPHQANKRILDALEKKLKLSPEAQMVKCIINTGNLSSATMPVALHKLWKNQLPDIKFKPGHKLMLTAVGGGYTSSAVIIEM